MKFSSNSVPLLLQTDYRSQRSILLLLDQGQDGEYQGASRSIEVHVSADLEDDDLDDGALKHFSRMVGEYLVRHTGHLDAEQFDDSARCQWAKAAARELRPRKGEDAAAHNDRIRNWVASTKFYHRIEDYEVPPFTFIRTPPPLHGAPRVEDNEDVYIFWHIIAPNQEPWARHEKPFVTLGLVPRENSKTYDKATSFDRPEDFDTFEVKFDFEHDLRSTQTEARLMEEYQARTKPTPGTAWLDWAATAGPKDPKLEMNLFDYSDGLRKAFKEGKFSYSKETQSIVERLESSHAGKFIISGVPGSGKSLLARELVLAFVSGMVHPNCGYTHSLGSTHSTESTHQEAQRAVQISETTIRIYPKNFPQLVPHKQADAVPGKALYVTPGHYPANTTVRKFLERGASVAKVETFSRMVKALAQGPWEISTVEADVSAVDSSIDVECWEQHQEALDRLREERDLFSDQHNLVCRAVGHRHLRPQLETEWTLLDQAHGCYKMNPGLYQARKTVFKAAATRVLTTEAQETAILVGVHFTVDSLINNVKLEPTFGVMDEAAFTAFPYSMLLAIKYPEMPCLWIGAEGQFPPVAITQYADHRHRKNANKKYQVQAIWHEDRALSFHERMVIANQHDGRLRQSHRARGTVFTMAERHIYPDMTSMRDKCGPVVKNLCEALKVHGHSGEYPILFLNVLGKQNAVGTSYTNETVANVSIAWALQIVQSLNVPRAEDLLPSNNGYAKTARRGRVMILTSYKEQQQKIAAKLRGIPQEECPDGLIQVLTIDAAQGEDAESVILCLDRDDGLGHMGNTKRAGVAFTRPRLFLTIIGNEANYLGERSVIGKSWRWARELSGWATKCNTCHGPGHLPAKCPGIKCLRCGGGHSVRDCKRDKSKRNDKKPTPEPLVSHVLRPEEPIRDTFIVH